MSDEARSPACDLAVIGFGFAGLATLAHVVRATRRPLRIAVIAPDVSGHGLAYGTRDLAHLLNVPAEKLGIWAHAPGDFARWLATPDAARHADRLGVAVPGPKGYAARALFACYLDGVREDTLRLARETGVHVQWLTSSPRRSGATGPGGASAPAPARFARGSARSRPATRCGPCSTACTIRTSTTGRGVSPGAGRRLVGAGGSIGCDITAVDAVLTLRELGFDGEISAFSRNGLIPRPHRADVPAFEYTARGSSSASTAWRRSWR